jgi:hypothetical protein
MKKILITGMNRLQCNKDFYLKQQLQVVPSHYSVIRCLEDMGYEVEQREVALGEDLSSYDEVIVYIHSIQAFCQHIWSGLYAVAARPNCIIAFDDWQFNQIYGAIQTYHDDLVSGDESVYRDYLFDLWAGKEDRETVKKYHQSYIDACKIIVSKQNRLLVSAFAGGDISLLNLGWEESKIFTFNPNPYHLNRRADNGYGTGVIESTLDSFFSEEPEKLFRWNFASLVQEKTRKWLKLQNPEKWQWDIEYFGAKRGKYKSERKTEPEMVKVFEQQWGCLMPGYFHAGSGWWRARPLQVADAGSIIIGDKPEMMVYYKDEAIAGLRVQDIEAMDLTQLKATAAAQKEALYATHPLNKAVQREELRKILEV